MGKNNRNRGGYIFSHYAENFIIIVKNRDGKVIYRGQAGVNDTQRAGEIFFYLRHKLDFPVIWESRKKTIVEEEIKDFVGEIKDWW